MRPVHYLGVFIPVAVALELAHASPLLIFSAAALGVIPCAAVMGEATEAIAAKTGPGIGGLLNVTFGNAPELIIAFFALNEGLQEVVKASIVGSIIGNILLVLGAAMLVGGLHARQADLQPHGRQRPVGDAVPGARRADHSRRCSSSSTAAGCRGSARSGWTSARTSSRSRFGVALILLATYAAGLVFSLKTHRAVFNPYSEGEEEETHHWSHQARR